MLKIRSRDCIHLEHIVTKLGSKFVEHCIVFFLTFPVDFLIKLSVILGVEPGGIMHTVLRTTTLNNYSCSMASSNHVIARGGVTPESGPDLFLTHTRDRMRAPIIQSCTGNKPNMKPGSKDLSPPGPSEEFACHIPFPSTPKYVHC